MNRSISLSEIIERQEFQEQLNKAADISVRTLGESYFIVYSTPTGLIRINKPLEGTKSLNRLCEDIPKEMLTDENYDYECPTQLCSDFKHTPGKGAYVTKSGQVAITLHFHPASRKRKSKATIPSPDDVEVLNKLRIRNLEVAYKASADTIINPVSIVGLADISHPGNYRLFAFQEDSDEPLYINLPRCAGTFQGRKLRKYKKYKGYTNSKLGFLCKIFGFRQFFQSEREFTEFMNQTGYTADRFWVKSGDFSDLKGIDIFQERLEFPRQY